MASARHPTVESALQDLQRLIRSSSSGGGEPAVAVRTRRLPKDLVGGETRYIGLPADEVEALARAQAALLEDLWFEHLGRKADDVVWHFAADCHINEGEDHVRSFVEQHGREPMDLVCYIPVENLTVGAETELLGIRLLPVSDPRIPPARWEFSLGGP